MKTKYLSVQLKQFLMSTTFVLVAAIGLTITNSFNPEHIAKIEAQDKSPEVKKLVDSKEAKKKDSLFAAN